VDIQAERVGVDGPHGPLLKPTSLRVRPGELVLVAGEPGTGHTALGLVLSGRMRPSTGTVRLDGRSAGAALRKQVALVDAPEVSEPEEALTLVAVVGEELAMARRPSSRKAVLEWLSEHDASEHASDRFEHVPPTVRCRLLLELAATRPGVRALILDRPDRYHPEPRQWWELARRQVTPERSVVVLCSTTSASLLDVPAARLGEQDQPEPLRVAEPDRAVPQQTAPDQVTHEDITIEEAQETP
jgi:ABC-type hemin transport system ATPase subunit